MPLPIFDTQDAVPEAFRPEYEERDGKWHPKAETELATEKRKRAELLAEKREEKRLREEAERKAAEAAQEREARESGVSAEALKKIKDAEEEARKPILDENTTLKTEIRKLKLTDRVQALYLANGGMSDRVDDAMKSLDVRTDLDDKAGIVFKDKDGNVTTDDAASFFAKHKKEKPWFYAGPGGGGSGAPGSGGSGGTPTTETQPPAPARTEQHRNTVASAL